jgi:site-specific DNA-methyltransferase (adenine-specific)
MMLPAAVSFTQWQKIGERLAEVEGSVQWWLGDWWACGEQAYGERASAVAKGIFPLSFGTLMNYGWVASAIETSRRREVLTFSHHQEIAPLPPAQQAKWLARAAAGEDGKPWPVTRLRQEIKAAARAQRQIAPVGMPAHNKRYRLIHSPIAELAQHVESESVDWIITDAPYPKEFLACYSELAELAAIVLRPGGSCLVMVGQSFLPQVIAALAINLTYHWTVAYLTPGGQATQIWPRKVNNFWKPLLWFTKGEASIEHWIGDVCRSEVNDNDKRFHDWGQSESGMADIIERFTTAGQTILDPFVGGGTTAVAAVQMNRYFIGADIDIDMKTTTEARLARLGLL